MTKNYFEEQVKIKKALNYIYRAIEQEYDEENDKGIWLTERINDLKNILNGGDE